MHLLFQGSVKRRPMYGVPSDKLEGNTMHPDLIVLLSPASCRSEDISQRKTEKYRIKSHDSDKQLCKN